MNSQLTDQRRARQARKLAQRREKLRIFTWGVAIPTLIALVYYLIVARPNYEVTMKFTVQGLHQNRPDFLTGIGIPAITPATNDGRIIVEYLKSTEAVRNLRRAHGFNDAYGGFTLDPMGFVSPGASIEKATRFWNSKAVVTYDATSNVVTADISAFSPEMSLKLARGTLDEATKVVNSLNSRVQNEATKAAEREMDRKKAEYEAVRDRMTRLRAGQALTLDAEQQQAGGHRVERAGVADPTRAEGAAHPRDDVMAGHPRGLVDEQDSGRDHLPSLSAVRRTPRTAAPPPW